MELPIYFISDVHLMLNDTAEERQKRKSLYRFLNYVRTTRGTLFFVGDLFDFYFEYPDMIPKAYFDFYNKAYQLKKAGVNLRFIAGNHDYWLLDFMKEKIMNQTYFDDTTFSLKGKKALVIGARRNMGKGFALGLAEAPDSFCSFLELSLIHI